MTFQICLREYVGVGNDATVPGVDRRGTFISRCDQGLSIIKNHDDAVGDYNLCKYGTRDTKSKR